MDGGYVSALELKLLIAQQVAERFGMTERHVRNLRERGAKGATPAFRRCREW
ncbi:hypothetical protein OV203_38500 [Nannocystis sp. ILAH1]|uniref:hypothetical protein n=1 Tax=Nannocystis sp. ILAH1 TaxID=2996789 RepID=UPI00226D7EC2|nr:hypothetical protein [Nannocystis sp. ILAH1]MCY0993095.1 hypothetical protein [Nannocystis sp. ILAH1]